MDFFPGVPRKKIKAPGGSPGLFIGFFTVKIIFSFITGKSSDPVSMKKKKSQR